MRRLPIALSAILLAGFIASPASAAIYDFNVSLRDGTANFVLDSATGTAANAGQVDFFNVAGTFAGASGSSTSAAEIVFGKPFTTSGIPISPADFQILGSPIGSFEQFSGPALFTGSTANPVFTIGTFNLSSIVSGPGTITISAAVPEPGTWAMMLLGFCGLGFMAYRKKSGLRLA